MSITFAKTEEKARAFQQMQEIYQQVARDLQPVAEPENLKEIEQLANHFQTKVNDFFRKDRKLNLGIVGRVKAGKSSFLNMLLFQGKDVLPRAFTPKTATLTKIEYGPQNSLEVKYYSTEEWERLKKLANAEDTSEVGRAARELVTALEINGINAREYTEKESEKVDFPSEAAMMGTLNHYVGENGELTPLVKSVVLTLNRKELEGLSIVDTPGLNDPVSSRTLQTREFLELCDAVFFLSPASNFLNQGDVTLLQAQLPQKGVRKLVLICSRFDEGLVDASYDFDSLEETLADTKKRLRNQALKIFHPNDTDQTNINTEKLLEACKHPLFLSSLFHTMIGRSYEQYNALEKKAYDDLNEETQDLDDALIQEIGDIGAIEKELAAIVQEKDSILANKAENFVPAARQELAQVLKNQQHIVLQHLNILATRDKEALLKQRQKLQNQIHSIQAQLETEFGNLDTKVEQMKISCLQDLRRGSREYGTVSDRTGTETKTEYCRVSTSHWYNPFSWGSYRIEPHTYESSYTYVDVSDALENLRNYANESSGCIEEGFAETLNLKSFKNQLLKVIVEHFDLGSAEYSPDYFRLVTERTLNNIRFPVIHLTLDSFLNKISSQFSGELRDGEKRNELKHLLAATIGDMFTYLAQELEKETQKFHEELKKCKEIFAQQLMQDINDDFEKIVKACDAKEASIQKLQACSKILEDWTRKLSD